MYSYRSKLTLTSALDAGEWPVSLPALYSKENAPGMDEVKKRKFLTKLGLELRLL
jgi:hypothetical protein